MGWVVHRHVRRYMAKVEELTGMMSLPRSFLSIAARDAVHAGIITPEISSLMI